MANKKKEVKKTVAKPKKITKEKIASTPKKQEPKNNTIAFKEKVEAGNTVTIASERYIVLKDNKLKSKVTGEVFDIV